MNKRELTQAEIEKRFAEINAMEPEEPTAADLAAFVAAKKEDPADAMALEEFKKSLEEFSGKFVLRMPRSMHKELAEAAKIEGVSLNQYILYRINSGNRPQIF